jgi:uncharacterized protein (TIGR03437 family)
MRATSLVARRACYRLTLVIGGLLAVAYTSYAAPPDRITRPVDPARTQVISGNVRRAVAAAADLGPADPAMQLHYVVLVVKPTAAEKSELDRLLIDQQNPASSRFRRWLTPEQFGESFGLSAGDQSRVAAWLTSAGFTINRTARSGSWIAFSGSAGQVSQSLHTSIHRFQWNGESHFAITQNPAVPEALADVVSGFLGLDDFHPTPLVRIASLDPDFTSGSTHYMAPADFETIYDVAPLYPTGINGTGQGIAVVGESEVLLTDLAAFRSNFGLPANTPTLIPYTGSSPGFNGAQIEGSLDLEWAGAIAPNATIYYVYGPDAFEAMLFAIDFNIAPVLSISYGTCEIDFPSYFETFAQEANAQGMTILNSAGDSGAAGCDLQASEPFAARGEMVGFPAALPEVTGIGGTEFMDENGTYWSARNSASLGSALGYIPEGAWNESGPGGLGAGGGGASILYPQPLWQAGPGVPNDNARHVPDVALSAAIHDAYLITYQGELAAVGGTSAPTPSMAGLLALLNHYQVNQGFQKTPGLGNINPQLYRMAQSVPTAFHDVTSGNNIVPCAQGSPDCLTGSFGYTAGPNYDMATGLGSIDANLLVTNWNAQTAGVTVTLTAPSQVSLDGMVTATATVSAIAGGASAAPAGTVAFSIEGLAVGSAAVSSGTASVSFPVYQLGAGSFLLTAEYSGDSVFSSGGTSRPLQITVPSGVSAVVLSGPNTVWANPADAQGLSWQANFSLQETAGVPAVITGFSIDGTAQTLAQYFPSPQIPADGTAQTTVVLRNLSTPSTHTFVFSGTDASGQTWARQIAVNYYPLLTDSSNFLLTATPLIVTQNTAASATCQWPVLVHIDDQSGYEGAIATLMAGSVDITAQVPAIFGTERLEAWGSLEGTVCFSNITPPASNYILVVLSTGVAQEVLVEFAGPTANSVKLSATPAQITLTAPNASFLLAGQTTTTLYINISDPTQPWTAAIYPANPTSSWLSISQLSGAGPATITLTAAGKGFEPGVYRASVVIQSANAQPQWIDVPVMMVLGGSSGTAIGGVADPATYHTTGSPGMLVSVFGSNLANSTASASSNPLPYTLGGVTATVNGVAAPLLYVSPGQVNLQIPYSVGAGQAALGINNNGQIAGFWFPIAPQAPGVFADSSGNLVPQSSFAPGGVATLYVNGVGDAPELRTAFAPPVGTPVADLPTLALPLSVTVGGALAFLNFTGIPPGEFGVGQVNFTVPSGLQPGPQAVVVTVNSVSSPPVNLMVTASAP